MPREVARLAAVNRMGIERIVDRLHVSATPLQVCRAIYDSARIISRTVPEARPILRAAYLHGLQHHRINQDLYRRVQRGF